jgi:hypothetical protein
MVGKSMTSQLEVDSIYLEHALVAITLPLLAWTSQLGNANTCLIAPKIPVVDYSTILKSSDNK